MKILIAFLILLNALFFSGCDLAVDNFVQNRIHSDMNDLLPEDNKLNIIEKKDLSTLQTQQSRNIVLLVPDSLEKLNEIANLWQKSGLFREVKWRNNLNPKEIFKSYPQLSFRTLPPNERIELLTRPEAYFAERANSIVNPFAAPSALPPNADWLGFSRFFPPTVGNVQAVDGHLRVVDNAGQRWYLLHGELAHDNGVLGDENVSTLLAQSRAIAPRSLVAGGAIFAAEGRQQGVHEGRWMSAIGLFFTLALIGFIFRRGRILLITIPIFIGGAVGFIVTVAIFGGVHLVTLVIASSLIGLLIDFPLHWLGKSIYPAWHGRAVLQTLRRPFFLSLLITLFGYAFLLLTDLPILRQTAVFSLAALPTAWLVTLFILPPLLRGFRPRANPAFSRASERLLRILQRSNCRSVRAVLLLFCLIALPRGNWQDDIRQWVHINPATLSAAQRVAQLTGLETTGQWFLLHGKDEAQLLQRDKTLTQRLEAAERAGVLQHFDSLSQWLWTPADSAQFAAHLRALVDKPQAWQPLTALGIPAEAIQNALRRAAASPSPDIAAALQSPLAKRWQGLFLGRGDDGQYYGAVRLYGVRQRAALAAINMQGVRFIDPRARANALFLATRNQALTLKLASYLAAALVLLLAGLSWRASLTILAVPLSAALLTLGLLSVAGVPISLFVAFGLLLISAVGIDYAVYAQTGTGAAKMRFAGMLPAALTTIVSFGLLTLSSTPAVAAFGLTVALGIAWSLLLATWLLPPVTAA